MNHYTKYKLDNGLQIVYQKTDSLIAYCGVVVGVGSRHEQTNEYGLAHFIEHLIFKGTKKRKAGHIINRLEDVGGELNAFTTKEETVVYSAAMKEHSQRAIELIADMVQYSVFPQNQIDKEREVVKDEILSYKDSPSELIIDEFEELIFESHSLAHGILGTEKCLDTFDTFKAKGFYENHYVLDKMVFFFSGNVAEKNILKWCEKYFDKKTEFQQRQSQSVPTTIIPQQLSVQKNTFQTHVMIGGRAYDFYSTEKVKQALLNNIIGGPGMNSLLNLSLREKNGLVYNVESILQSFTDTGWWGIYFAADNEYYVKSKRLVLQVLKKTIETPLSDNKLNKYKKQLIGQLVIAAESRENSVIQLGKSILRYGEQKPLEEIIEEINDVQSSDLQQIANTLFAIENLSELKFY